VRFARTARRPSAKSAPIWSSSAGGFGGCAAALAAARHGLQVVMSEETDGIGGQLTSQAVPLDENARIETIGAASYRELRARIRDYYRRNYPLTDAARVTIGGEEEISCSTLA
jgi:NADPH-dependent 2,4-dienoyl-CoA reductase/sulfur reductase-like enzyme